MSDVNEHSVSTDSYAIIEDVLRCAKSWNPNARLLGNVKAGEIVDAMERVHQAVRDAFLCGYRVGHHDTVNGEYQCCDQGGREKTDDYMMRDLGIERNDRDFHDWCANSACRRCNARFNGVEA